MNNFDFPKVELKYKIKERPVYQVKSSKEAHEIAIKVFDEETIALFEDFYVFFLNKSCYLTGIYHHSKGGFAGTVIDIRMILQAALLHKAYSFFVVHNHPSGNLNPSQADIDITKKIDEACNIMDIQLCDHIIISPFGIEYFSFIDEGLL